MKPSQNSLIMSHLSKFSDVGKSWFCPRPWILHCVKIWWDAEMKTSLLVRVAAGCPSSTPDGRSIGPVLFVMLAYFHLYYKRLTFLQKVEKALKHVGDVRDRSSTPKGCNAIYVRDVGDHNNLQYTQCLMVWLKSPKSQLSKTFFGLKIH